MPDQARSGTTSQRPCPRGVPPLRAAPMLSAFRRLSKSKLGTFVAVAFLLAILASFAIADIGDIRTTSFGGASAPVKVGSEALTERDISRAMERALAQVRQQNPDAQMSDIIGDFDTLVSDLSRQLAITAFADKS